MLALLHLNEIDYKYVLLFIIFDIFAWIIIPSFGWIVRHYVMINYLGFEADDISLIESYRLNIKEKLDDIDSKLDWTYCSLNDLKSKYGKKLIYSDMISRKIMHHIPTGITFITFFNLIGNYHYNEWFLYQILMVPIKFIWYYFALNIFPNIKFLRIISFGGVPRIRDGHYAYYNAFGAFMTNYIGQIGALSVNKIIYAEPTDPKYLESFQLLVGMTVIGAICGDAAGELIGAPFGKHQFKVKGFGEINRKSIEGCCAVFIFTLIPGFILIFYSSFSNQILLYILMFFGSFITMIIEALSFRGTDNALILIINAIFYSFFFAKYDIH